MPFAGIVKLLDLLFGAQDRALSEAHLRLSAHSDPIFRTKLQAWRLYDTQPKMVYLLLGAVLKCPFELTERMERIVAAQLLLTFGAGQHKLTFPAGRVTPELIFG